MLCQYMQSMILFPPEQRGQEEKHIRRNNHMWGDYVFNRFPAAVQQGNCELQKSLIRSDDRSNTSKST